MHGGAAATLPGAAADPRGLLPRRRPGEALPRAGSGLEPRVGLTALTPGRRLPSASHTGGDPRAGLCWRARHHARYSYAVYTEPDNLGETAATRPVLVLSWPSGLSLVACGEPFLPSGGGGPPSPVRGADLGITCASRRAALKLWEHSNLPQSADEAQSPNTYIQWHIALEPSPSSHGSYCLPRHSSTAGT